MKQNYCDNLIFKASNIVYFQRQGFTASVKLNSTFGERERVYLRSPVLAHTALSKATFSANLWFTIDSTATNPWVKSSHSHLHEDPGLRSGQSHTRSLTNSLDLTSQTTCRPDATLVVPWARLIWVVNFRSRGKHTLRRGGSFHLSRATLCDYCASTAP